MTRTATPDNATAHTTAQAAAAVGRAWAGLIGSLPRGGALRRASGLAELLGINTKLAWQVWRAAREAEPLGVVEHLPGAAGVRIVLEAALRAGAAARTVRAVEQAMERFDTAVREHAGDRASLGVMLGAGEGEAAERVAEEARRQAFQGASALWGVQARAQWALSILHSGRDGAVMDAAAVRGVVDLRRLRAVPWLVARAGCRGEEAKSGERYREPIETSGPKGVPLLASFCSRPLPRINMVRVGPTLVDLELEAGAVGETGAVTLASGDVFRNLPRQASPEQPRGTLTPLVFTPCEVMQFDVLVHEGVEVRPPFSVKVYGDQRGEGFEKPRERNLLPIRAQMVEVGRGLDAVAMPELPRYRALVQHVHKKLGWRAAGFGVYRLRIRYPVMPSMVMVEFELE